MNTIMCMLSMILLILLVPARGADEICSSVSNPREKEQSCHEFYGSNCNVETGKGYDVAGYAYDVSFTNCSDQGFPYFDFFDTRQMPYFSEVCFSFRVYQPFAYRGPPCPGWDDTRAGAIVMDSVHLDVTDVALVDGFEIAASSLSTLKMIKYDTGVTREYLSHAVKIASAGKSIALLMADNTIETAKTDEIHRISSPWYDVTAVANIAVPGTIKDMSMSKVNGFLAVAAGSTVYFKKVTGEDVTLSEIAGTNGEASSVTFRFLTLSTVVWSSSAIIAVGGMEDSQCKVKTYSFETGEISSVTVPSSVCNLQIAWSPDSSKFAVSYDREVDTVEVQPLGIQNKLITSQLGDITSLVWCPQNFKVVAGTNQGRVYVHDFQNTHNYETGSDTAITGMDITNDGEYIVLANGAGVHTMKGGAVFYTWPSTSRTPSRWPSLSRDPSPSTSRTTSPDPSTTRDPSTSPDPSRTKTASRSRSRSPYPSDSPAAPADDGVDDTVMVSDSTKVASFSYFIGTIVLVNVLRVSL